MKVIYFLNRANKETSFKQTQIVGVFLVYNEQQKKMYSDLYNQISSQYENLYAYETVNGVDFLPNLIGLNDQLLSENIYYVIDIDVVDKEKFDLSSIKKYLYDKGIESFIQKTAHGYHLILPQRSSALLAEMRNLTEGYRDFNIIKAQIKSLDGIKKNGIIYKTEVFTGGNK